MKNLKVLRQNMGLTQRDMAKNLNLAKATYARYEIGETEPNFELLIKMADYFEVSLDYLCGRQNSNTIFVDSLTEEQKKIVSLVRGLTHDQSLLVLGYLSNMLKLPYEDVRPARPF